MKEPLKKKNEIEELLMDAELKSVWDSSANYSYPEANENDAAWNKMLQTMQTEKPLKVSWIKRNMWLTAAAASVALILGVTAIIKSGDEKISLSPQIAETTGNAQLKTITLDDGSVVYMNSNSSLVVKAGFGQTNRDIELVGEARFEVAKNPNLPFTVSAGKTKTAVLGTGFTISAYKNENVKIAVFHGKVSFGSTQNQLILTRGNLAAFDVNNNNLHHVDGDTSDLAISSDLIFKRASLAEVALQVKHRYGKTLKFDAVQSEKLFTGRFVQGTTAEEIASALSDALQISVTVE